MLRLPACSLLLAAALAAALGAALGAPRAALAQARECGPGRPGCYLAAGGEWRDAAADHDALDADRDPDHLRSVIENALFLGGGAVWYWLDIDRNVADWDYDSWKQRMTWDAFRYDNNGFGINWIWHPMSGAGFHAAARANDHSLLASFLYGFATSFAWEFLLEFRERISINDMLVTTGAGIPIGELAYKLALTVQQDHPLIRWTAGLPVTLHDAMDGRRRPPVRFWRRLRLSYGLSSVTSSTGPATSARETEPTRLLHDVTFEATVASIPGYLAPGRFERVLTDADLVSLRLRVPFGAGGAGLDLLADALLLGWHRQSLAPGPGGTHGDATTLGTSLAYQYRNEAWDGWTDRLASLGLPGAALDTHLLAGPLSLSLRGRLHPAFAGVHAAGYPAWEAANADQVPKSILRKQGYYYGWGLWTRLDATLALGPLELSAHLAWSRFDSHEGLDRTQELVTADVEAVDSALDWEARLRWRVWRAAYLEVATWERRRGSRLGATVERGLRARSVRLGASW